jgi:peptide/nickel transport system permease protein
MRRRRLRDDVGYFIRQNPKTLGGIVIVTSMLLLMAIGPSVAPFSPEGTNHGPPLAGPSGKHPFGTDTVGADVLSRVIAAPRTDVFIAVIATLLAAVLGVPLGTMAGFYGGGETRGPASWASQGTMRLMDIFQAFPIFILAMILVAVRGPSVVNVIVALAFVNAPVFVRLTRSEILRLRKMTFVEASRCCGTAELKIAFRELLPNTLGPALTLVSMTMGYAIILTAGLSFIGAGVREPTPEWGLMISKGAADIVSGQWWTALFPGMFLGLTVFGFALVGETVRRYLDPAWRGGA